MGSLDPLAKLVDDYEFRLTAARERAQWELGDPSWADRILAAFGDPEGDQVMLVRERDSR
jgi:hypothetical protein